jgi:methyl-accepting chemotaxis protein
MFSISNLKVGVRLTLGFGVVLALMAVLGGVGVLRMGGLNDNIQILVDDRYPKVASAQEILKQINRIARSMRNSVLMTNPEEVKKEIAAIGDARKGILAEFEQLQKTIKSADGKAVLQGALDARTKYIVGQDAFMKLAADGKKDEAIKLLFGEVRPLQLAYFDSLNKLIEFQQNLMKKAGKDAADEYGMARTLMISLAAAALAFGALMAFLIAKSIINPLHEAMAVAGKVAAGDLTSQIEVKTKDETGQLLQSLKDMNESLVKIVGEVRSGTEAIGSGTKQIASGNADLSQRTEEQASSLEETASSMEELTSTVKQNAENAKQANQLALGASNVAVKGGQVVSEVVTTMSSINESSKKIVDIIGVIDGIAFQTNILALNAAVEAARAGEQGRGFAVVASEVRNLAQRSAAAAKEIKALIGDSVDKVGAGTKLVDEAGKTMEEIVNSVKRVTDIMSEITAASQEQSAGIEQVNQAITQMDEVTQQNAALVEEAAAAAESLEEQAQNLQAAVAIFNIGGHTTTVRSQPSVRKTERPALSTPHRSAPRPVAHTAPRLASRATKAPQPAAQPAKAAPAGSSEEQWEEF